MAPNTGFQTRTLTIAGRRAIELTLARFTVSVTQGCDAGLSATLSAPSLCVGTDPGCDLVLTDPTVSKRHVIFTMTPQGILAEDSASTNGTWLGDVRIRSAVVPEGSTLKIGSTHVRVTQPPAQVTVFPGSEDSLGDLLGGSQAMRDVYALIRQLAKTDLPVLITGETGSGKELVARALHKVGPRKEKPFLVLDCGSIVSTLIRSEIFGYEKGAFTGADQATRGILEEAAGGTVFFDEIGEIEPGVQPNLLRALETREICRLGSRKPITVDFRVVAATNRDLARMVAAGRFREDLYFRLACATIRLPPLRERIDDIPALAAMFLSRFAERNHLTLPELTAAALGALQAHHWPGNVRQLRNVVELACTKAEGGPIAASHVREALPADPSAATPARPSPGPAKLDDIERTAIEKTLVSTGWNRKAAAKLLGISRTTLLAKIRRYGLTGPDDREP